jgi:sarcosine oxidase subunit gamma
MRLIDHSSTPRSGVKGAAATERVREAGAVVPATNAAAPQSDGSLLARLGENEYLVLGTGALLEGLTAFRMGGDNEVGLSPVPRFAGTAWLSVTGERLDELFAKVCGVDMRPGKFANHQVAQTIVARTTAILIRDDLDEEHRIHIVFDVTTARYLKDALDDAMVEFR